MSEHYSWIADLKRCPATWPFQTVEGNKEMWIQKRDTLQEAVDALTQPRVAVTGYPAKDIAPIALTEKMTNEFRKIMLQTRWSYLLSDWLAINDATTFSQFLDTFVRGALANPEAVRSLYKEKLPQWNMHQAKIKELSDTFDILGQHILKRIEKFETALPNFEVGAASGFHIDGSRVEHVHQDAPIEGRNYITIIEPVVGNGPMFAKSRQDKRLFQFDEPCGALFYGDTWHVSDLDNWGPRVALHFQLYHRKNNRPRGTPILRNHADHRA